jgi:hypothetical protein
MYRSPGVAPLVAVTMNYIQEDPRISAETMSTLRDQTQAFLENRISFAEAAEAFCRSVGTYAPIERLRDIIQTSETPLSGGVMPPERTGRRKIQPWTMWEDQRLLAGIYRYGLDSWDVIAEFVGNNRTRAQCCQRWCRGLDPGIAKDAWTTENDDRLLTLVALHGNKSWTQIACELGNRCDVQCRYRYNQLAKAADFEIRMRAAAERAAGMCHIRRPRKRPAKRTVPHTKPVRRSASILPQRVRLPPIESVLAFLTPISH